MAVLPDYRIPLEAQFLYRRALDLSIDGKTEDALGLLKKVVFIAPRFCNAYNVMGNCLDELGRYQDAIKKFDKVLDIDPHHGEARFKRDLVIEKIKRSEAVNGKPEKKNFPEKEPFDRRNGGYPDDPDYGEFPFRLMGIGLNC